ncbi:MAG TPA: amino acid adenylation domain-containing protein [Microlunatus sp.]
MTESDCPAPRSAQPLPLSFAQQRLWLLDRLHGGGAAYSAPLALRLHGSVDTEALAASLVDLVGRHESLRTVFPTVAEVPYQRILEPAPGHPELVVLPADEETVIEDLVRTASQPFDLATDLPIRARLFVIDDGEAVLLLVLHHIVCDGWSLAPLLRDLALAYEARCRGEAPGWDPLPVQYGDFSAWQHELLGSEDDPGSLISAELDHWRSALAGLAPELALPSDRPRPSEPTHRGALVPFHLDAALAGGLRTLASEHRATLFMVLQAAVLVVLHRWGAGPDLAVGTPVAGRTDEAMDDLVGFFVNTLVLRTDTSGDPDFAELLRRVRETDLAAYAHQDLPFERLVEVLNPPRSLSRHPLFQVNVVLQSNAPAELALHGLQVTTAPVRIDLAKFDLTFAFIEKLDAHGTAGGIDANLEYAIDLYDRATAEAFARALVQVLTAVTDDARLPLSSIPLLTPAEREQIVEGWNATGADAPEACLHDLITDRLRATPDAVAVTCGADRLTARQLDERSGRLANLLRSLGAGPGTRVGLCLERSSEMVVGVLGVLRAGAAYLPLEPSYPADRIALMIEDARLPVVITHAAARDRVPTGVAVVDLDADAALLTRQPTQVDDLGSRPDDPAYVIYTSGSTGRPKAVVNHHRGIVNRLTWMQREYGLDDSDVVLQKTPFSFDVSVWELCWPLLTGARLVVARPEGHKDPAYLAGLIREERVTTLHFVPSMLEVFTEVVDLGALDSLRRMICSGEALPADLTRRVLAGAPRCALHNLYGPTEAAIDVSHWTVRPDAVGVVVPIGRPVDNTRLYVLDGNLEPVPPGVAGELCLGGVQVADGYLDRPSLTAERFVANPFHPGRMYRTGDLARWRPDGVVEFLGRVDHQIKLRGFRIELGEVEAALRASDGVREAAAVGRDGRLVAYVVGDDDLAPTALREQLGRRLPEHLVPAVIVVLDALPLSSNGKLDRAALPDPGTLAAGGGHEDRVAARDGLELELVALWEELLGVRGLGVTEDFFARGGTSLLVIRMLGRLARTYGVELPVAIMFTGGDATVEKVAREIRRDPASRRWSSLVSLRSGGSLPPLFCLPAAVGNALAYVDLARLLPEDRPIYGLQAPGLDPGSSPVGDIDGLADVFVEAIRGVQSEGPYHIAGYCAGSITALAVAERLRAAGQEVALLAAIDGGPPAPPTGPVTHAGEADTASWFAWELGVAADRELDIDPDDLRDPDGHALTGESLAAAVLARAVAADALPADTSTAALSRLLAVFDAFVRGVVDYRAPAYDGPVVVFRATEEPCASEAVGRWASVATGEFRAYDVPGNHYTLLRPPNVDSLAVALTDALERAATGDLSAGVRETDLAVVGGGR